VREEKVVKRKKKVGLRAGNHEKTGMDRYGKERKVSSKAGERDVGNELGGQRERGRRERQRNWIECAERPRTKKVHKSGKTALEERDKKFQTLNK